MSHMHDDQLLEGLRLDERPGPAKRITRDQSLSMIDQALNSWEQERPARERRAAIFKSVAAAAAILLAMAGGASAARWYYGPHLPTIEVTASKQDASAKTNKVKPRHAVLGTMQVELDAASAQPPEEIAAEPELTQPRAARAQAHEKAEPEDLMQRANRLRAEGRFQSAAETYALVYTRYPRSLSAYAAQVAAGSIELEHLGKPNHARKLFEGALRGHPHGALDLEARQGLALSLRDMGKDQEEIRALRALIKAHTESPAARRAEARLEELSDSQP